MGNPGGHGTKLRTAGEVLIAGFAAATLLSLAIAVFRTPSPPDASPLPPINTAGWSFDLSDWRILAGLGAIAVVVAVVLVLRNAHAFSALQALGWLKLSERQPRGFTSH